MTTTQATGGAYRDVLRLPGVRALSAFGFLARIPATAAPFTLTLHVVLGLGHGYAAAGLLAAATTVGMGIGAPLLGRLVDARGLRVMLVAALTATVGFWGAAPYLGYRWLLVGAFVGGVLGLPVFSLVKQSMAVLVPEERRRAAFAVDSMSVELSYIIGPAAGTLVAVQLSTTAALWLVGGGLTLACVALYALNPPTRSAVRVERRHDRERWLDRRLVAALVASGAAVGVLFGTELAVIASLQTSGQATWIAVVNGVWCLASLAGGYVYGRARRGLPLPLLVAGLGVATLPVALGGPWWTFALLLVPAGALCAPSLTASSDVVTRLAPEHARGLVTGLQSSAMTLGTAVASPLSGAVVDAASPAAAILVVGGGCVLVAAVAALLDHGGTGQPGTGTATSSSANVSTSSTNPRTGVPSRRNGERRSRLTPSRTSAATSRNVPGRHGGR